MKKYKLIKKPKKSKFRFRPQKVKTKTNATLQEFQKVMKQIELFDRTRKRLKAKRKIRPENKKPEEIKLKEDVQKPIFSETLNPSHIDRVPNLFQDYKYQKINDQLEKYKKLFSVQQAISNKKDEKVNQIASKSKNIEEEKKKLEDILTNEKKKNSNYLDSLRTMYKTKYPKWNNLKKVGFDNYKQTVTKAEKERAQKIIPDITPKTTVDELYEKVLKKALEEGNINDINELDTKVREIYKSFLQSTEITETPPNVITHPPENKEVIVDIPTEVKQERSDLPDNNEIFQKLVQTMTLTPEKVKPLGFDDKTPQDKLKGKLDGLNEEQLQELVDTIGAGQFKNTHSKALWNYEIDKILKPYRKRGYLGCFSIDEIHTIKHSSYKLRKHGFSFIMNTGKRDEEGIHWIAVIYDENNKSIYYCDPFADEPSDLFLEEIKPVIDAMKLSYYLKLKINGVVLQDGRKGNCGWHAIGFIDRYYNETQDFKELTHFTEERKIPIGENVVKKEEKKFGYIINNDR
jgi:hypothetical protein